MFPSIPSPPLPASPSSPSSSPPKQHHDSDPVRDFNIDMSLEHQLLSLRLGDEPQDHYPHQDQQLPLYIQSPQQHPQSCHPLDRCEDPKPVSLSSKKSKSKDKSDSSKGGKRKSGSAFSAISKRFSPSPPPRSLSTPAVPTLASLASDAETSSGSGSESGSADALMEKQSGPLPSPFKDHTRHHSVSGVPSQDSKRSRSSCASSCSASSSTSSTSSLSSCSATSSSSSSSPFFSPSAFYNSLFGNNNNNQNFSINPLASIPTSGSTSSSSISASPPFATTDRPIKMGSTRQVRSVSCTPSFSLPSLSIPRDSSMVVSDSQSPIGNRSPEAFPLTQARLNPQLQHAYQSQASSQSILQRSNPVSPTGALPACTSPPSSALSLSSAFSPTALPPLPLFFSSSSSFFPATSSVLFSSSTFPSTSHSEEISSTAYQSVVMGAPLPSVPGEAGGMVTSSAFVNCDGNSQAQQMHHPIATHPPVHPHAHAAQSFEAGSRRLEMSLPNRSNSLTPTSGNRSLMPSTSTMSSSCNFDPGFLAGSRRSSKDSVDSVPGVTLDDLVDQLTIPDYINTLEQIAKTKVFLMIYRKFLRPRELLEMFIERFEELGEFVEDDDEEARNTRLRICACLYYWLKNHPNDLIHRQTRQRVASFLRERVAFFPCLNEIYVKLLPLSSIHYFNSWRWPHIDHTGNNNNLNSDSGSFSISGPTPTVGSSGSDEDCDSGFHDVAAAAAIAAANAGAIAGNEYEMDEDREWGLFDEDEAFPEMKKWMSMDNLAPYPPQDVAAPAPAPTQPLHRVPSRGFAHRLPRDRRSSTGSLAHTSPCAMEAFVANRRGSASSVSSGPGHSTLNPAYGQQTVMPMSFAEGDMTPYQQQQQLQPMVSIPFINKRSSSQAYRQKTQQQPQGALPVPLLQSNNNVSGALVFRETAEDSAAVAHGLKGKANPVPQTAAPIDYSSMNTPFIEIKDAAIAAQLTCVEFGLFRKLKPRDMLRQVWKTSKGSTAFQACIAHFNFISSWVGTMILSPSKAKNRAKMMEKFINIAKILRDIGNFNTTMAIIGAMNTSSIHRLVQTRELLQGKEVWATFKELEHLMSSERSFFEYRQALKVQKPPCIPYLGVHLGDLLSISEGNRDFRQDGTIHWQKFCLLTEVISTVILFQSEPYAIQPDPFISRVITDTHVLGDEELYTKSVGTEPGKLHHSRSLSKFNFF